MEEDVLINQDGDQAQEPGINLDGDQAQEPGINLDGDQAQEPGINLDGDQAQEPGINLDGVQAQEPGINQDGDQAQIDYSQYLIDINDNLDSLNVSIVDLQQDVAICRDNGYRQYYFIGGLYVVFFIIIAIKFFKQFF